MVATVDRPVDKESCQKNSESSSSAPPSTPLCQFQVVDEDCCDVARRFVKEGKGKVGLLIHGNGENPGGGYKHGARGQEEVRRNYQKQLDASF